MTARNDLAEFRAGDTCENVTFPQAIGDWGLCGNARMPLKDV